MADDSRELRKQASAGQRRLRREIGDMLVSTGTEWAKELIDRATDLATEQKHRAELAGVTAPEGTLGYEAIRVAIQQLLVNGFVALHQVDRRGAHQWLSKILVESAGEMSEHLEGESIRFGVSIDKDDDQGGSIIQL